MQARASRARRWVGGAWRELEATVVDLSSRGVGVSLSTEVHVGDRLSLVFALAEQEPELRATVEVRHVRVDARTGQWRAGGLFRGLAAEEHARVMALIASRE
jgi:PilZ domain